MKSSSPRPPAPPTHEFATPTQDDLRRQAIWKKAYGARTQDDLRELYRAWAADYDRDHAEIGFQAHRVAAEALARHLTRRDVARVLDAGAGTGAAGEALAELGFRDLTAVDLSADMLARAEAKGVYRECVVADISLPIDAFAEATFDAAILVGVFSYGQAPAETLDEIVRLVRPGGVLALTMRTDFHSEDALGVRSRLESLVRRGALALLERTDAQPYLPKKDPGALFRAWCFRVTGREEEETLEGFEETVREVFTSDEYVKSFDHAWIWDSRASRLYDRYTQTKGYYLTDCEEEILRSHAAAIVGDEPLLVELGCGSARKIQSLIAARLARAAADEVVRYMPIDVSPGALAATQRDLERRFERGLELQPRLGLFEDVLSEIPSAAVKQVFFFGSSLGNLESLEETVRFLERLRAQLHPRDRLVVGLDLHKDEDVLERAYCDEEACRAFFVHMLRRINEHLGADFDPRVFELSSTYEEEAPYRGVRTRRVNLRVAPRVPQRTYVRRLDLEAALEPGQPVQVGISRKFEPDAIRELAALAGFELRRQWLDGRRWFSLNELVPRVE